MNMNKTRLRELSEVLNITSQSMVQTHMKIMNQISEDLTNKRMASLPLEISMNEYMGMI